MTLLHIIPDQIAVICPTKDQTEKVKRWLTYLAASTIKPGQVLQLSYAHLKFLYKIKLVIHFDDDITFDKYSIGKMLPFWSKIKNNNKHFAKSL